MSPVIVIAYTAMVGLEMVKLIELIYDRALRTTLIDLGNGNCVRPCCWKFK